MDEKAREKLDELYSDAMDLENASEEVTKAIRDSHSGETIEDFKAEIEEAIAQSKLLLAGLLKLQAKAKK